MSISLRLSWSASGCGDLVLLPAPVTTAIADRRQRVVGVVLNTIDDALAKHDPGGTRWTLPQIQHLRALLNEAALAGRVVILTSDHGHVIERGGEPRPVAGAGARWRSVDSGALASDEVMVTGSRVLTAGGSAILARAEGLRYTAKAAGYHGGASLAELTIPVLVFRRQEQPSVTGWVDAVPQTPVWWNEASRTVSSVPLTSVATKPAKKTVEAPSQMAFDLEVPADNTPVGLSLTRRVIESEIFVGQQLRAGRGALNSAVVAAMLDLLLSHDGRVHKDTLAATAGIAANAIEPTLAMLRRLLNVEGYEVVATDTDGKTVLLDSSLLREQFGLGQSA
ncbi:BREX-2 system phosphatase PglZ [Cryobacterium sp. SO1]|uniref:BREX-2 system phosphatase PglZ n=1 Tax=Cryobacterium sp. SO1 TaxID=1897061 RepID=UPI00210D5C01|nr:BREX-2 system phosphatase PglZ [Cryobacterium sp. SO1]